MPLLPSIRRPSQAAALAAVAWGALVAGCERVSYWSGPTAIADGDPDDTTGEGTSSQATGPGVTVDEAAVLRSASLCASELYGELATTTATLALAATSSASTGADVDREAAQAAWRATMDVWEQAEAIRVGPVGPAALPGGSGARDEIYAWPMTSRCLVEQTIVSRAYEDVEFGQFSLVNVRGLGAAEYLLFYDGADNACAPTTSINATGAWAALSNEELRARKRDYAAAVATTLDLRVRQVDEVWRSDGGDFGDAFAASGAEGAPYATSHAAVQALYSGLVVVTRQLRDDKLGAALDVADCSEACELVEAPFARVSARLARRTVDGLARVFRGCAAGGGVGLDDLLDASGHADVAARASAALDAASVALAATEGDDLASSLDGARERVEAARSASAELSRALEVDVAAALQLETPEE